MTSKRPSEALLGSQVERDAKTGAEKLKAVGPLQITMCALERSPSSATPACSLLFPVSSIVTLQ